MSLLVTPEQLARELASPKPPLLLDLRPVEESCRDHLPGAVHLDLFGISSIDTDPAPLKAFFWIIEHLLASRGVSNDVAVVVYDDTSGIRAARAFWFLEFFGHPDARLLTVASRRGSERDCRSHVRPSSPRRQTGRVAKRSDPRRLARRQRPAGQPRRGHSRYAGATSEYCGTNVRAARGGAVPGAVHVEWTNNLGPDGAFKSVGDLKAMYERAGVTPRSGSRDVLPGRVSCGARLSSRFG